MNALTRQMYEYRHCLKMIWNVYFTEEGDWDDRVYFCNAAVELFRGIVLYSFDENDREVEILPAYRGDKAPFHAIRIKVIPTDDILMSIEGTFRDTKALSKDISTEHVDMRYVDLFDFDELGMRPFKYVKVEIVESVTVDQIGVRLLIPFDNVIFEKAR